MPFWAEDIANGDLSVDRGDTKGGGRDPEWHGYIGAGAKKKALFNKAVEKWIDGDTAKGARTFGKALHTLQDVLAHRRYWERKDGTWQWRSAYGKPDATSSDPRHRSHKEEGGNHDLWDEANQKCRNEVSTKSINLIWRFKILKKH